MVKLKCIKKQSYRYIISRLFTLMIIFVLVLISVYASGRLYIIIIYYYHEEYFLRLSSSLLLLLALFFYLVVYVLLLTRPRPVYLIDYSCYTPPDPRLHAHPENFLHHSRLSGHFSPSSLDFQRRILLRSGLGPNTVLPDALHSIPPSPSLSAARTEASDVIFGALDALFSATGTNPASDVGILVINCSLFNPVPSLSSTIIHRYNLPCTVRSFNLAGMGCSAGVLALDLARNLLELKCRTSSSGSWSSCSTSAVVVSTENITQNWYVGNKKSMLVPNCLFRVGCSALLLSNRRSDRSRAKYQLAHVVRTHCGSDDRSFRCVYQDQDDDGNTGVSLSKELMSIAGDALRSNITTLGPLVLPITEQLLFLASLMVRKLVPKNSKVTKYAVILRRPYRPEFKLAFEHLCIHAGGRSVIDELEQSLELSAEHVEASRMTLYRFGNTSSSSIWYELAYLEAKGRVKKGHRVWQIAFGSGFKCNSAVWVALRNVDQPSPKTPWLDCIDSYPVDVRSF